MDRDVDDGSADGRRPRVEQPQGGSVEAVSTLAHGVRSLYSSDFIEGTRYFFYCADSGRTRGCI